jgi:hypothetical protein
VILSRPTNPTLVVVAGLGTDGYSGDGGPALVAQFSELNSMFFDDEGRLVIADSQGGLSPQGLFISRTRVRRIATDGTITTLSGDGTLDSTTSANGAALSLGAGGRVAPGPAGVIFIAFGYAEASGGGAGRLGRIDADGSFHLLVTSVIPGYSAGGGSGQLGRVLESTGLAVDRDGTVFLIETATAWSARSRPRG